MSNYLIPRNEALADYKRRIETAVDLLEAAQKSARSNGVDIIDLNFVMTKLDEFIFRLEINLSGRT